VLRSPAACASAVSGLYTDEGPNSNNQLWYFEPTSGGYLIRNFKSRQILEVSGGSTTGGAAIDQSMPVNESFQTWTIQ
jgi:hypothetical protein